MFQKSAPGLNKHGSWKVLESVGDWQAFNWSIWVKA